MKCDVTGVGRGRRGLRGHRGAATGRSRCSSPNAGITNDGLLLRMSEDDFTSRHRRQPHRRLSASPSGRRRGCCGPGGGGSSSCRRSSACSARPARRTTPRPRPASSAWPARSPASSAPVSITVNVVAPGPVATDMTAALRREPAAPSSRPPCRSAASPRPTRSPASCAFLASADAGLHHRRRDPRRRRPRHGAFGFDHHSREKS